jgi:hypothetical protein
MADRDQLSHHGGLHAPIGMHQALNRNDERVFTDRKDLHWGRRKWDR